ncbi:MAG: hypothetical protein ACOH2E_06325 [Candidatus Paracaedibacter sp.]
MNIIFKFFFLLIFCFGLSFECLTMDPHCTENEIEIFSPKSNYLKNTDIPFLVIGCGHFTPNTTHETPSALIGGQIIGKHNYYSCNDMGTYEHHQHDNAYTVHDSGQDFLGVDIKCDLKGPVGRKTTDDYLFNEACWKIIYPENVSFLYTSDFLKKISQGLQKGGALVTSMMINEPFFTMMYPFVRELNLKGFETCEEAQESLNPIFKNWGYSHIKIGRSRYRNFQADVSALEALHPLFQTVHMSLAIYLIAYK